MKKPGRWEAVEKSNRTKKALAEHARLSELYKKDPTSFELERRRLIVREIAQCHDVRLRKKLEQFQSDINRIIKGAGSDENKLMLMQAMLTHKFVNEFIPALKSLEQISTMLKESDNKTHLKLC